MTTRAQIEASRALAVKVAHEEIEARISAQERLANAKAESDMFQHKLILAQRANRTMATREIVAYTVAAVAVMTVALGAVEAFRSLFG